MLNYLMWKAPYIFLILIFLMAVIRKRQSINYKIHFSFLLVAIICIGIPIPTVILLNIKNFYSIFYSTIALSTYPLLPMWWCSVNQFELVKLAFGVEKKK